MSSRKSQSTILIKQALTVIERNKNQKTLVPENRKRSSIVLESQEMIDDRIDNSCRERVFLIQENRHENRRRSRVFHLRELQQSNT
jgi:hypothetical protein